MAKKAKAQPVEAEPASTPVVQGEEAITAAANAALGASADDTDDDDESEGGGDEAPVAYPEDWVVIDGEVHQRPVHVPQEGPPMVEIRPEADFQISLRGVLISFREGKKVPVELDVLAAIEENGAPFTKVGN